MSMGVIALTTRYSTSGTLLVVSINRTDSEKKNVSCLLVGWGSLCGHLRTNFFRNGYAHAARIQVEALAEAIVVVQPASHRVPCVWSYQS